jgi:murein L,D-transpeptidase YafK
MRSHLNALILLLILNVSVFLLGCGGAVQAGTAEQADRILVIKSSRALMLMKGDRVLHSYKIALGRNPIGPKTRKGDHQTPEGSYVVDAKKDNSRFYMALHLSYPNDADRLRAKQLGVDTGGDVEIHGIENGLGWIGALHRRMDWTDGCIAVTDAEISQIWRMVSVGTPVEIKP